MMLMLSSAALAAQESQQLGPYAVSFDMNTDLSHQLMVADAVDTPSATIYSMQIFTDNSTKAVITISKYDSSIDSTLDVYKQIHAMKMALLNGFNTTSEQDKTIDGKEGFLLACEPFSYNTAAPAGALLYDALFWLDSQDCECGPVSVGTTSVEVISSYPQGVTESLLSTLHVAEGQAAASSAASSASGQILPPG
jgi:hypothetical protein